MLLQKLQEDFISKIGSIYERNEASNIFQLIIDHLTGINLKSSVNADFEPDQLFYTSLETIIARLQSQEPVQYILNESWFYDIPFFVDAHVLIPRPETEELVYWIIKEHSNKKIISILDVGTGSGCIPIILKRKLPDATVYSCDISKDALDVAQKNASRHNTSIHFLEVDFLNDTSWDLLPALDIIVSNPPYIPMAERTSMRNNVLKHEPHQALFVHSRNPLLFYDSIARAGKKLLNKSGEIYVEIHENYGKETIQLFENYGYLAILKKDMQHKNRFVKAIIQE